jgi:type IV secretory pathway TraG/TraD family ATPase VirD4
VVIGTQDTAQLQAIYGQDGTNAWTSMIGTSIYGRIQGGPTAQSIAKRIGDREVERPNEVNSHQSGQASSSLSYTREVLPIILQSQLLTDLGTTATGVKVLLDGFAEGVYLLEYPYAQLTKKREASLIAAWVQSKPTQPNPAAAKQAEPSAGDGTAMDKKATATAVGSDNSPDNQTGNIGDHSNTNARKRLKRREELDGQQEEWL